GNCRASIWNGRCGHADVVEVKDIAKYRRELELQLRGGARRIDGERVLRIIEWGCKSLGENVRATPSDRKGRRASLTDIRRQPEGDNVRAAWRRRDVLADGIVARGEGRLKLARIRGR